MKGGSNDAVPPACNSRRTRAINRCLTVVNDKSSMIPTRRRSHARQALRSVILWLSFRLRLCTGVSSFQSKGSPRNRPQGP